MLRNSPLSLPTRERGLKYFPILLNSLSNKSLPTRERGLKFFACLAHLYCLRVAPYAGAWIEILRMFGTNPARPSLPTRERGLKF